MFEFESYHILMAAAGAAIILSYWLPRFLSGREPAASAMLVLTGCLSFALLPGMPPALDPLRNPTVWERAAELCVIIGLFGTGLRIDRLPALGQSGATLRLLLIAMPLTIAALAILGWAAAGMTLAGGLLLGAVLAPTDPVLAGDVQVGPPHEGGEHPVRYALTSEAGLNDGLAFPFVHLGILVAGVSGFGWDTAGEWLARDVLYRIVVGGLAGWAIGWVLGKVLFHWPRDNALACTQATIIAFAGVLIAYGMTEVIEGYGFIAAFLAGVTLRRQESDHAFHADLHDFSESLEHTLTAILLLAIGAALPGLLSYLGWQEAMIALALVFVIRPFVGWASLIGTELKGRERLVVAFYGVRGIGSVYYLAYAGHHLELTNEPSLWAIVALTIVLSTIVHGLTAGIAVERATGETLEPEKTGPRSA